ncbi:hypothetical protein FACS1894110_11490 [Spirochaetia bacterium]|nr:hypothetical protein FACS1894110_11490 [Spirochaetia bacterium]
MTVTNEIKWNLVGPLTDFWGERQQLCLDVTLPIEYQHCIETGRVDALKKSWLEDKNFVPHHFWDSDIAKWIEAAAYSLAVRKDPALEQKVDEIAELFKNGQEQDGYFNSYYFATGPENRFTNLKVKHELYCLGHLIEGAVAYYEATGKAVLLDVVRRYADLLITVFGTRPGQLPGYDGHEEIELALVKLFKITGEKKYLTLSRYFINQRGTEPHFFDDECTRLGEAPQDRKYRYDKQGSYAYYQAHRPVRDQQHAVGHAVRAVYLYSGMADVAAECDDAELLNACRRLWRSMVSRQFYITGGIGPNPNGERFTYDYDLPNPMSYNETCASIGLFFFAHRMMLMEPRGEYGDIMERCLFNNILGGESLSGDRFFYANPLAARQAAYDNMNDFKPHISLMRQEWFDVACCPPNLARLMMSLGGYIYYTGKNRFYINQYIGSSVKSSFEGVETTITQTHHYPWDGKIKLNLDPVKPVRFSLCLRLPVWSRKNFRLTCGGENLPYTEENGFLCIPREWKPGDTVILQFDMGIRVMEARPEVAADCGRVALERGPLVFCFEEDDNGARLNDLSIYTGALGEAFHPELLGGVVTITGKAARRSISGWQEDQLYRELQVQPGETFTFTAVPFYARLNRKGGEMVVWALNGGNN